MKPTIFSTSPDNMERVSPAISMSVTLGESFSIAAIRFVDLGTGAAASGSKPHSHGEETSLVLKGGATIQLPDQDLIVKEGDVLLMGADIPHSGFNHFPPDGECVRLNFVTPPRAEYVASGGRPYYPSGSAPAREVSQPHSSSAADKVMRTTTGMQLMEQVIPAGLYEKHLAAISTRVTVSRMLGPQAHIPRVLDDRATERAIYFLRGGCELEVDGEIHELREGEGVLVPAGSSCGGGSTRFLFKGGECRVVTVAARR